jgi:hypothetical protein
VKTIAGRYIFRCAIVGILAITIGGFLCGMIKNSLDSWVNSPSKTEITLQHVKQLLQAVQQPDATNSAFVSQLKVCGDSLASAMKRNNNQYTIQIVGVWGTYASPIPGTGTTTSVVNVVFPDRTIIEMQFYGYALNLCREIGEF